MRWGALSDIGRQRKLNEDRYFIYRNEKLLGGMVSDGMGGENAGEVASAMATQIVKEYIMNKFHPDMDYMEIAEMVRIALIEANRGIYNYAKRNKELEGMGTTATLVIIYKRKLIIAHVGDSRAYLIEKDSIRQITKDHSYVQELLLRGEITKEAAEEHPARNCITRAVGTEDILKVDVTTLDYNGETVLICSDGLTNMLCDEQILEIMNENEDLQAGVYSLIDFANKKGGLDNITVVAFDKEI